MTNFDKFQMIEANRFHQSIEDVFLRGSACQNFFTNILLAAPPSGQTNSSFLLLNFTHKGFKGCIKLVTFSIFPYTNNTPFYFPSPLFLSDCSENLYSGVFEASDFSEHNKKVRKSIIGSQLSIFWSKNRKI